MGTLALVTSGNREIGRRGVAAGGVAALLAVFALLAWAAPAPAAPKSFATGVSGVYGSDPLATGRVRASGASFIHGTRKHRPSHPSWPFRSRRARPRRG